MTFASASEQGRVMTMADDLVFRIVGPCIHERRLVDGPAAFVAYASLDKWSEVNCEAQSQKIDGGLSRVKMCLHQEQQTNNH